MDKETLEQQYSPSRWSQTEQADEIINKHCKLICKETSDAIENTIHEMDVKYGIRDRQKLDIFFPKSQGNDCHLRKHDIQSGAPVLMFIHGGYWQELGKEYYGYLGRTFSDHGIITIIVGYDLAPNVKLATIFDEVKDAVIHVSKRFSSSPITIVGHSAGAHLAALLLKVNWTLLGIPNNPVKAIVPISGVYDLRPLVKTYINEPLRMDEDEAWMLSPLHYVENMRINIKCQVLCMIAEQESLEFHRQSKEFYQALQNVGFDIQYAVVEGTDHFSVMHNFAFKNYKPIQQIVDLAFGKGLEYGGLSSSDKAEH